MSWTKIRPAHFCIDTSDDHMNEGDFDSKIQKILDIERKNRLHYWKYVVLYYLRDSCK
jgi:hypothetical protein